MTLTEYVDTMMGTVGDGQEGTLHGGGKTYPGACCPGGMVQLSPDTCTGGDNGSGYHYGMHTIEGFSLNHMSGVGWYGDLGNLQIMPVAGPVDLRSGTNSEMPLLKGKTGWRSEFSHENEMAKPGYYSCFLQRYSITVEATATRRTGCLRLTYRGEGQAGILWNLSRRIGGRADYQWVDIIGKRRIEGAIRCTPAGGGFGRGDGGIAYTLYFVCELSRDADDWRFFSGEEYAAQKPAHFEGGDVGLEARFTGRLHEPVVLRCGISYTDLDGARVNLESECPGFDFDRIKNNAGQAWEDALHIVEIPKGEKELLTLFYTCLYHTLLDPRTAADADGRCRLADGTIFKPAYQHLTMFSGWDVYRSEFPLLTLIDPQRVNDTVSSLLTIASHGNTSFPRWELMGIDSGCMVGDPGLLVMADAYMKGIRDYDFQKGYAIAKASLHRGNGGEALQIRSNRPSNSAFLEHAYVPFGLSETLEFLLADYAMYVLAEETGNREDAAFYRSRAESYRENYNPAIGFMNPRDETGQFVPVEDEYDERGCVESNLFQQTWFVPYDVGGLMEWMGKDRANALLERLFEKADLSAMWNFNYNHSNEPCHNLTHYFNILGAPSRTQYWTRRVQREAYRPGAYGFCGNEDVGQLSAWYVLSAMGFAQICPANGKYQINTPLFENIALKLNPKYHSRKIADKFTVECDKNPLSNPYIEGVFLNGEKLSRNYVTYQEITAGGKLCFVLSAHAGFDNL